MAWKTDADGNLVLDSGNPVYVGNDGNEVVASGEYVGQLRGEAMANRIELKTAKDQLKAFEGIDPSKASEAIAKLKDIDLSKMISSDKLDEVRAEVEKSFQGTIDELKGQVESKSGIIHKMKISGGIQGSEFLKKTIFKDTPEVADSYFAKHFSIDESGEAVATLNGETIYSVENPGKPASVNEALGIIVGQHPQKDHFLLGNGASGSGAQGSNASGQGSKSITRQQFDSKSPQEQASFAKSGGTISD